MVGGNLPDKAKVITDAGASSDPIAPDQDELQEKLQLVETPTRKVFGRLLGYPQDNNVLWLSPCKVDETHSSTERSVGFKN